MPVIWVETELPHSGQPYYLVEDMRILGQVPHPELQHGTAKPKPDKERNLRYCNSETTSELAGTH